VKKVNARDGCSLNHLVYKDPKRLLFEFTSRNIKNSLFDPGKLIPGDTTHAGASRLREGEAILG
jgi:hypothetical protein